MAKVLKTDYNEKGYRHRTHKAKKTMRKHHKKIRHWKIARNELDEKLYRKQQKFNKIKI